MLELLLSVLILAAVAWQWRRWLRQAYDRGLQTGYALAQQNDQARQERLATRGLNDGRDD